MADEASPAPNSGRCVYGFALLVLSICGFVMYFVWAVVPGSWLVACGLDYFSSKYFALAVPVTGCVSIFVFAAAIYPAINMMLTERANCIHVLVDDHSRCQQNRYDSL
jgi:phosphatidylinositol glycan class P protein